MRSPPQDRVPCGPRRVDPGDPVESAPVIEARGLTKRYGALVALRDVDLDVEPGESLSPFGPNGAGKTTLTRILALSLKATSGTLRIAGHDPRVNDRQTKGSI